MRGLPSTRATSGRAAKCLGDLAGSFHKNSINDVERMVLKPAFTQPLQDWPLSRLRLVEKGLNTNRPFSAFVCKLAAALRSAWSANTTKNSAC